jgi:nitric oxide reductase NorD protein
VAPVCLWLLASPEATAVHSRADAAAARTDAAARPDAARTPADATRRQAERVDDGAERAPFMLFFRAESLLSWGELVRVNRATDDDPDDQASAAANDMDELSVAPDGAACASRVKFDLPLGPGIRQPEWDCRRGALRPDHCSVQTFVARPDSARPAWQPSPALKRIARQVQRRLEVLRSAPRWARAQEDGEAIDLDAWVRHTTERGAAQRSSTPAVYARRVPHERSLATLLLADLSLSTDAHVNNEQRVIDVIRDALWVFGEALQASGDAFAMLGFSSVRRQHVRMQHLLGFSERWDDAARTRVAAIKPGYYTRMGAAIRLATRRLAQRPERQRLLLILTDGKPNDIDVYEGRWGLEDTRHAVIEARQAGLVPFCLSIDEAAHHYLPHLFGQQGWARVSRPAELPARLATVYARLTRSAA